jgi:hypothetical protein
VSHPLSLSVSVSLSLTLTSLALTGWRLLLYYRCFLRRKSVTLLRNFFLDFASFRLPYIMMKYRTNAVHLQRFLRSYIVITKVRSPPWLSTLSLSLTHTHTVPRLPPRLVSLFC